MEQSEEFDYSVFNILPSGSRIEAINKFITTTCCRSTRTATDILMTNQARFFSMKKVRALTKEFIDSSSANALDKMTLAYHIYVLCLRSTSYQRIGASMIVYALKDYLPPIFWKSEIEICDSIETYWIETFLRYNCEGGEDNTDLSYDHIIEEEAEKFPVPFVADKWDFPLQITFVD